MGKGREGGMEGGREKEQDMSWYIYESQTISWESHFSPSPRD